jgi:hypothetical protein
VVWICHQKMSWGEDKIASVKRQDFPKTWFHS